MKVTLKLFSNLMEYLPQGAQGNMIELSVSDRATVYSLVDDLGIPRNDIQVIMRNGEFCPPENRNDVLSDEDKISVWPSIQGG